MTSTKIALVQMAMGPEPADNLRRATELIGEAAGRGAALVCLPELFLRRYFCQHEAVQHFDAAEPIPGPTTQALAAVARRERVALIVPLFERRAAGVFHNSAALLDAEGALSGVYRKMHIPDDPGYYEKYYFAPGDLGFLAFDLGQVRIAVLICWDQWYPEAARLAALRGASVLFYPTAIGWHPQEKQAEGAVQRDAWRTVQRGHAVANGVYVAAANRVGHEPGEAGGAGIEFWGSSFVCDPQGVVLAEAGAADEQILLATIESSRIEQVRRHWPFLRDRRIDAYADLQRRFIDK
ncbi:MAG: carbon-nitrogen hydrolase [Proteobacteria bacterium]|nr:carbon-nitrogen hydrolase [Pseudomonadota bacterium]